jgi:hypothetical protein
MMECKMKSQDLLRVKEKYESQLQEFNATLDGYNYKVSTLQESCNQNKFGQEMQLKSSRLRWFISNVTIYANY